MSYSTESFKKRFHVKGRNNNEFHIIKNSPYERNDPKSKEKWQKLFVKVDAECQKKEVDRAYPFDVVFERLKESKRGSLASMLNIQTIKYKLRDNVESADTMLGIRRISRDQFYQSDKRTQRKQSKKSSVSHSNEGSSHYSGSTSEKYQKEKHLGICESASVNEEDPHKDCLKHEVDFDIEQEEDCGCPWDLIVHPDISAEPHKCNWKKALDETEKFKIVKRFLKLPKSKAAHWRNEKISPDSDIPLATRVQLIEDTVAAHFVSWFRGLGGIETGINETVLKEFFEIGMVNPASQAFKSVVKENATLSEKLAEANNLTMKSLRNMIMKHVLWNAAAQTMEKKTIAFDKLLPVRLQSNPPDQISVEEWLYPSTISKEMENLSVIFSDKLHFKSLQKFCLWLQRKGLDLPHVVLHHKGFKHILDDDIGGTFNTDDLIEGKNIHSDNIRFTSSTLKMDTSSE